MITRTIYGESRSSRESTNERIIPQAGSAFSHGTNDDGDECNRSSGGNVSTTDGADVYRRRADVDVTRTSRTGSLGGGNDANRSQLKS